jgi:hypothetical protein
MYIRLLYIYIEIMYMCVFIYSTIYYYFLSDIFRVIFVKSLGHFYSVVQTPLLLRLAEVSSSFPLALSSCILAALD